MRHGHRFMMTFIIGFLIYIIMPFCVVNSQAIIEEGQGISVDETEHQEEVESNQDLPSEAKAWINEWPDTFAWRAATTGTGSFPFTYFFTNLAFDLVRFGISGFDSSYAPWPFRNQNSANIASGERVARIGTALGVSLAIGLLDSFLSKP